MTGGKLYVAGHSLRYDVGVPAPGTVFSLGKGAFLIAGYNTAPKREKEKYDEKALCRFMGKLMFALAAGLGAHRPQCPAGPDVAAVAGPGTVFGCVHRRGGLYEYRPSL